MSASTLLCGFGSCTPRVYEICRKKIPELNADLENAKLALRSWDPKSQNRAIASSLEGIPPTERELKIEQLKTAIRQVRDDRFQKAMQEMSPDMIDKAIQSIPPSQIPDGLRGATAEMVLQAWQDVSSSAVTSDVSYMDPRDRLTWKEWAIDRLKETQQYLDSFEADEEARPAYKELSEIAYLLVEFSGYAEQGKSTRMILVADKIKEHSERVRELACESEERRPAAAASPVSR
ncbi:MAG: hypothetical protein ACXWP5_06750 [Bdellovibrionota bacterium]